MRHFILIHLKVENLFTQKEPERKRKPAHLRTLTLFTKSITNSCCAIGNARCYHKIEARNFVYITMLLESRTLYTDTLYSLGPHATKAKLKVRHECSTRCQHLYVHQGSRVAACGKVRYPVFTDKIRITFATVMLKDIFGSPFRQRGVAWKSKGDRRGMEPWIVLEARGRTKAQWATNDRSAWWLAPRTILNVNLRAELKYYEIDELLG